MKKLVTAILVTCMVMSLTACGTKNEPSEGDVSTESVTTGGELQSTENTMSGDTSGENSEQIVEETSQPEETESVEGTTEEVEKYPFVGITYKHEDLNLTFKLHTPDANGYPTEISLNGVTYSEVTFDNNTYALSNVSITEEAGAGANVTAYWYVGEQEYMLNIQESGEDSWKMFSPGVCSGYYYPE